MTSDTKNPDISTCDAKNPKNSTKRNKLMKYIKKVKIAPNFKIKFEILSQGPRKKIWAQNQKKIFCRVPKDDTRQSFFLKKNKNKFCRAPGFPECQALGKVQICRVPDFAECKILPSATLGKILLCRVPRYFALGKISGTR